MTVARAPWAVHQIDNLPEADQRRARRILRERNTPAPHGVESGPGRGGPNEAPARGGQLWCGHRARVDKTDPGDVVEVGGVDVCGICMDEGAP